jgi:DNA-binding NtrC family response regulator
MSHFKKLKEAKILLVDDDEFIRDSLSIAFTNKECFMRVAGSTEEGLKALEEQRFDIVISDLRLPGQGGLEFLRLAKIHQPHLVDVLITAFGDEEIVLQASVMGVHGFIPKPFSVRAFAETLARLISKNHKSNSCTKFIASTLRPEHKIMHRG